MISHRQNELVVSEGLKDYLSTAERPCEVVRQNQISEVPPYPYVSYTLTTPIAAHNGTYSQAEDGTLYRDALQTWSFTVQSDDQEEALTLALKAYDYFAVAGVTQLADKGITVRRVRDVSTRDNLITIQYEYRQGLDVTFGLLTVIAPDSMVSRDVIESNTFKEE